MTHGERLAKEGWKPTVCGYERLMYGYWLTIFECFDKGFGWTIRRVLDNGACSDPIREALHVRTRLQCAKQAVSAVEELAS